MEDNINSSDTPAAIAARWISETVDGDRLLALAMQLARDSVPDHSAQQHLVKLAESFLPAEAARSAAIQCRQMAAERDRAVDKLGEADGVVALFDLDGLQMASHHVVSGYHADLFRVAGARQVYDLTAGIGADAIAFARAGLSVIACELDPVRAIYLRANAARVGLADRIEVREGDFAGLPLPPGSFVYLDPPRRTSSGRWGNLAAGVEMVDWAVASGAAGVLAKLAPSVDHAVCRRWDAGIEFISAGGECKEALARIGSMKRLGGSQISAVMLPGAERLEGQGDMPATLSPAEAAYLYEPDPAVIRAGLTGALAARYGLSLLDRNVAYLLGSEPLATPFATGYRILAAFPYHRRTVQAWLDEQRAGSLIVKKRGVPDDPEKVRSLFKLRKEPGRPSAILALAPQGRRVWAIMLERL